MSNAMNYEEYRIKKGGKGSGFFKHSGRKGEVGGSSPEGTTEEAKKILQRLDKLSYLSPEEEASHKFLADWKKAQEVKPENRWNEKLFGPKQEYPDMSKDPEFLKKYGTPKDKEKIAKLEAQAALDIEKDLLEKKRIEAKDMATTERHKTIRRELEDARKNFESKKNPEQLNKLKPSVIDALKSMSSKNPLAGQLLSFFNTKQFAAGVGMTLVMSYGIPLLMDYFSNDYKDESNKEQSE